MSYFDEERQRSYMDVESSTARRRGVILSGTEHLCGVMGVSRKRVS